MLLINLPSELIIVISEFLENKELNALVQTASRFTDLLGLDLLDRGLADPELEILLWAAAKGNEEIIRKILLRAQHKQVNIAPQIKDSVLMTAVRYHRVDPLEYLVRTVGANLFAMLPHKYSVSPRTALHEAAEQGDKVTTQKLIELGAEVNAIDSEGLAALHYAVAETHNASQAISYGADVAARGFSDLLPLHNAVARGVYAAVVLLVEGGSDVNARTATGWRPLDIAVNDGFDQISEYLKAKGAVTRFET